MSKRIYYVANNFLSRRGLKEKTFKIIKEKNVCLKNCSNSRLEAIFPETKTLFVHNCEKNYVYYNVFPYNFPRLTTIYCDSHPCEYSVLHRHANLYDEFDKKLKKELQIFITENWYYYYYNRWFKNYDYIKPITQEKFLEELSKYKSEN